VKKLLGLGVHPDGLEGARACIDTSERPRSGNDTSWHKTCILFLCTRPKDTDLVAFGCSLWAESRLHSSSSQVFVLPANPPKGINVAVYTSFPDLAERLAYMPGVDTQLKVYGQNGLCSAASL